MPFRAKPPGFLIRDWTLHLIALSDLVRFPSNVGHTSLEQ